MIYYIVAAVILAGIGYLFLGAVLNTILETIYLFEDIFSKKEKEISTDELEENDYDEINDFFNNSIKYKGR